MFSNENNVYELIEYYKNIHKYFIKNKEYIYNVLKGLENEIVIQETKNYQEEEENDFSNFYFFYIQTLNNINLQRRSGLILKKSNNLVIKNEDDFLVGLNFSNCEINSEIRIYLNTLNFRKKIFNTKITEKNKNNIFLPINNKDFFPYFLTNRDSQLIIHSNKNIQKIDVIYLKLHRNYSTKFLNFGSVITNFQGNTYLEFKDYHLKMKFCQKPIPNFLVFYWDQDKYYGRKILNYYKNYKIKEQVKELLEENYDYYDDISNLLCKFI